MLANTIGYSAYAFSTMSFLVQLDAPPSNWRQLESAALQSLYVGPGRWAPAAALHGLPLLGFPTRLPDLHSTAMAAKYRVCQWEAAAEGGLHVAARAAGLRSTRLNASASLARLGRWSSWFDSAFLLQLDDARKYFLQRGMGQRGVALAAGTSDPTLLKKVWQRTCARLAAPDRAAPLARFLRHRLSRWACGLSEQEMADRALRTYPAVASRIPPRALAACLRSLWNGWVTARRFQGRAGCCFGCATGEDSIEHYADCPCVAEVAASQLGLPRPASQEERLSRFLLLSPPHSEGAALELQRRALVTASVYLTHCWARHAAVVNPVICVNALKLTLRQLL